MEIVHCRLYTIALHGPPSYDYVKSRKTVRHHDGAFPLVNRTISCGIIDLNKNISCFSLSSCVPLHRRILVEFSHCSEDMPSFVSSNLLLLRILQI